jgi:hypothetical protein
MFSLENKIVTIAQRACYTTINSAFTAHDKKRFQNIVREEKGYDHL